MNRKRKIILLILGFVLLISAAAFAYNKLSGAVTPENRIGAVRNSEGPSASEPETTEEEKTKAPDFTAVDADGNSVKLSDLFGKPIVLNFWASWCPPCKGEMPEFNEVYQDVGEDVTFVMVNLTDGVRETRDKGAQYVKDQGFSFPVYFDTEQEAADAYGIRSIPTTLFIDQDGYIVTGAEGAIDGDTLRKGIDYIK